MTSVLFAALAAGFILLFFVDRSTYEYVLGEDRLVENATAATLFIGAGLFIWLAGRRRRARLPWLAPAGLAVLLVLGALEEISWGQRILGIQAPAVFQQYSDQREINLHGVAQRLLVVRTKDVAALLMVIYGVVFPWMRRTGRLPPRLERHLLVPPAFLSVPFVIGALFMIDLPTGREEEIGEFLLSLCLCAFGAHEGRGAAV
jgi:hypothetical protein